MIEKTKEKKRTGRPLRHEDDGPLDAKTYRLSKRAHFALRIFSRQNGTTPAIFLDELLVERANAELVASKLGKHWLELFDPEEGIATLQLFALPRYRPDADEERLQSFVTAHAPFFYADDEQKIPHRERVSVLWPNATTIKAYAASWYSTRSKDVWGVAREMAAALKAAGASVPNGRGKW